MPPKCWKTSKVPSARYRRLRGSAGADSEPITCRGAIAADATSRTPPAAKAAAYGRLARDMLVDDLPHERGLEAPLQARRRQQRRRSSRRLPWNQVPSGTPNPCLRRFRMSAGSSAAATSEHVLAGLLDPQRRWQGERGDHLRRAAARDSIEWAMLMRSSWSARPAVVSRRTIIWLDRQLPEASKCRASRVPDRPVDCLAQVGGRESAGFSSAPKSGWRRIPTLLVAADMTEEVLAAGAVQAGRAICADATQRRGLCAVEGDDARVRDVKSKPPKSSSPPSPDNTTVMASGHPTCTESGSPTNRRTARRSAIAGRGC